MFQLYLAFNWQVKVREMFCYLILACSVLDISWGSNDLPQPDVASDSVVLSNSNTSARIVVHVNAADYDKRICQDDFHRLLLGEKHNELWARKVLDSWGSLPPTGHLYGRYVDLGNFDECMNNEFPSGVFTPQYCLAHYPLDEIYQLNNHRQSRLYMESRDPTEIVVGVCVPNSCDVTTLPDIFKELASNEINTTIHKVKFHELECTRREDRGHFTGLDIFAITIFGIIGILMILSTLYEIFTTSNGSERNDLLLSFSIITNSRKLFNVENNSSPGGTIGCLHGIRSLSIVWVVYSHQIMSMQFLPLLNHDAIWKFVADYYSMVVISGPMAVDTFFLISGLLVTLHVYKEIDRSGQMTIGSILKMYLHRYLRLFPILAATILFAVTLFKYIGDGPYWNIVNMAVEAPCRYFWWLALLYLQNYVNSSAMCLGHTWYLSADTQLYILSPFLLIPLKRWGKKFMIFIGFLILASCSYIFIIMMTHDFSMKLLTNSLTGDNDKKVMLYYGIHTRAPPYLVGIILGHLLYSLRNRILQLSRLLILSGWIACLAVISIIVWGPYQVQQRFAQPTQIESALFESLSRVSWAIALAWLIFACTQGYGGVINSFLSSPLWQPLSRLSYAIYVIHLVVQFTIIGMVRTEVRFTNLDAVRYFWSDFGLMLSISTVMVLSFESPMIAIEKYFMGRKTNRGPDATSKSNVRASTPAGSIETLESSLEGRTKFIK